MTNIQMGSFLQDCKFCAIFFEEAIAASLSFTSLGFVTGKMDSPVHFGQKRRANPDSPINLPGAYFVTLKISLQNFGKSWGRGGNWRNTVKINLFLSFPRFTALPRVLRQGVKGVKRVKWGFPDIWEVKSVSRWQSYTTNETLLMDFHRSEMELRNRDGG